MAAPLWVEVEPKRWFVVAHAWIVAQKRDTNHDCAIGEGDSRAVDVVLRWRSTRLVPVLDDDRELFDERS